jgi:hypothetical protein
MATEMNLAVAAQLRAPFLDTEIGKLPRIWCKACRDRACKDTTHRIEVCKQCGNKLTTAHLHLDYVGHAEVTDRLLQVDPQWQWEPVSFDGNGQPFVDGLGGMWIRLTVAGVSRLGYGDAGGKRGADAIKEAIGDAIRNAAMRFGVGLDLWGAKFDPRAGDDGDLSDIVGAGLTPSPITEEQQTEIADLWLKLGLAGNDKYDTRMEIVKNLLKIADIESTSELAEPEARTLIKSMRKRLAEVNRGKAKTSAVTE